MVPVIASGKEFAAKSRAEISISYSPQIQGNANMELVTSFKDRIGHLRVYPSPHRVALMICHRSIRNAFRKGVVCR